MILIRNIIRLISIILLLSLPLEIQSSIKKEDITLKEFNQLMNRIEYNFKNNEINEACINSKIAVKTIELNIEKLKTIEPNYSWLDIKNLLKEIPTQLCSI